MKKSILYLEYKEVFFKLLFNVNSYPYKLTIITLGLLIALSFAQNKEIDFAGLFVLIILLCIYILLRQLLFAPIYFRVLKYRTLEISNEDIKINNKKSYPLSELIFESYTPVSTNESPSITSVKIYTIEKKKIAEFYFEINMFKFFKFDTAIFLKVVNDLQNNIEQDYQAIILENIRNNIIDEKETSKNLNFMMLFLLLPIAIGILFVILVR